MPTTSPIDARIPHYISTSYRPDFLAFDGIAGDELPIYVLPTDALALYLFHDCRLTNDAGCGHSTIYRSGIYHRSEDGKLVRKFDIEDYWICPSYVRRHPAGA